MFISTGFFDFEDNIDDLASQYISRNEDRSFNCTLCGKNSRDMYNAKSHLEGVHFPPLNGYVCDICNKSCKSRHALNCHNSIYHNKNKK